MKKKVFYFIFFIPLTIFAQEKSTIPEKALVCAACHGTHGISDNPSWPNLAGQHAPYTLKQLKDIQDNKLRSVPMMTSLMSGFSMKEMEDLAAYYAKMPGSQGSTPKEFLARGQQLYRGGDFSQGITACIACHGPQGTGNGPAGFPSISGQHAEYTYLQLLAFKKGTRKNDLNHIMHDISQRMSKEDMEAVAHYIEGLH